MSIDPVSLARTLIDIDSTTGREARGRCRTGSPVLSQLGYRVTEQPVADGRFNVYAHLDTAPGVVFSTHFDCVPPFFPSREERGLLFGRGACDAKGILAAQVAAAESLARRWRDTNRVAVRRGRRAGKRRGACGERAGAGRRSLSHQRRADRQPSGRCHSRHPARAASRRRARRALVVSRAWRISHRQTARRADGAARRDAARRSAARSHALHGRSDRRRRGAERGVAPCVGGAVLPDGRRAAQPCARRCTSSRASSPRARARHSRRAHAHAARLRDRRSFRTPPTCRC